MQKAVPLLDHTMDIVSHTVFLEVLAILTHIPHGRTRALLY